MIKQIRHEITKNPMVTGFEPPLVGMPPCWTTDGDSSPVVCEGKVYRAPYGACIFDVKVAQPSTELTPPNQKAAPDEIQGNDEGA